MKSFKNWSKFCNLTMFGMVENSFNKIGVKIPNDLSRMSRISLDEYKSFLYITNHHTTKNFISNRYQSYLKL